MDQEQNNSMVRDWQKVKSSPNYVRQQKGHSVVKHILLCFIGVGFITIPYYSISPNHYWHF